MVNSIQRDQRRRALYNKFEDRRVLLKNLLRVCTSESRLEYTKKVLEKDISMHKRLSLSPVQASFAFPKEKIVYRYKKIPRNSSRTRVRNRCVASARGRGVLRFCKLSRIRVRELASQGLLSGVSKASW